MCTGLNFTQGKPNTYEWPPNIKIFCVFMSAFIKHIINSQETSQFCTYRQIHLNNNCKFKFTFYFLFRYLLAANQQ